MPAILLLALHPPSFWTMRRLRIDDHISMIHFLLFHSFNFRFYNKSVVEENECTYVKVKCEGHQGAPNEDQVRLFIHICQKFIAQHPLEIIAVHCTHGFNRTGFLIVSYLVEVRQSYQYQNSNILTYIFRLRIGQWKLQ